MALTIASKPVSLNHSRRNVCSPVVLLKPCSDSAGIREGLGGMRCKKLRSLALQATSHLSWSESDLRSAARPRESPVEVSPLVDEETTGWL